MIWRVILFCLLSANLALADLSRCCFVASVSFCSNCAVPACRRQSSLLIPFPVLRHYPFVETVSFDASLRDHPPSPSLRRTGCLKRYRLAEAPGISLVVKWLIRRTLRFYGFGRPQTFSAGSRGHRIIPSIYPLTAEAYMLNCDSDDHAAMAGRRRGEGGFPPQSRSTDSGRMV